MDVGFIVWAIFMHSAFLRPPDPFIDYNIFFVWLKLTFINYFENANSNWVQKVQPNPRITSCIVGWKVISQDGPNLDPFIIWVKIIAPNSNYKWLNSELVSSPLGRWWGRGWVRFVPGLRWWLLSVYICRCQPVRYISGYWFEMDIWNYHLASCNIFKISIKISAASTLIFLTHYLFFTHLFYIIL